MQSSHCSGEATKKLAGMTNKIVQGALDGKLGISQNVGVKLTTGTHIKSEGKSGQGDGEEEEHGQFRKKGQREKKLGGESFSVSNHCPPRKPRFLYLPIAPHRKGEGLLLQSVISLV